MQSNSTRDLAVGLFVLLGLGTLAYLSLQVGGLEIGRKERIVLRATFDDIGGLSVRAPVRIAGALRVYGTPAEEGGSGKVYLTRDGLFEGVDVVLHWHPSDLNRTSTSTTRSGLD